MQTAKGTILHKNWDEKPYNEVAGLKSTEANIDLELHGDVELAGKIRSLMQYPTADTCHYAGYATLTGTVGGKSGSFILCETGTWKDGVASSRWEIVEGSGTGDLKGLRGSGSYAAEKDKSVHYQLTYEL